MHIKPFELERYYERWEFKAELMLSSSDCESLSVAALLELEPDAGERLQALGLGYTEVPGSPELRAAIAGRYERAEPEDVLALAAAEEGIFLAYHALLGPGDHVVVEAPCYGSAIEIAHSTGASVSLWQRRDEEHWAYDLQALERLLRADTKLLYVNSPHNPTGTQMGRTAFERVVELARERSTVLFSDEVYRGLEHDPADRLPAAADCYERAISLNTVSKAYGLPGLRIGWLASRDRALLARIRELKLYTTICCSAPSELLVALALRHGDQLVERSRRQVLANLPLVDALLERRRGLIEWVRPSAGPIGFPRVAGALDVRAWCERIAEQAGVLLLPGTVYGQPRHVRVGFGRANLAQAIARLEEHLDAAPTTPGPGAAT
jgi:aspartate/methionine/tyrosine aminotransferase